MSNVDTPAMATDDPNKALLERFTADQGTQHALGNHN